MKGLYYMCIYMDICIGHICCMCVYGVCVRMYVCVCTCVTGTLTQVSCMPGRCSIYEMYPQSSNARFKKKVYLLFFVVVRVSCQHIYLYTICRSCKVVHPCDGKSHMTEMLCGPAPLKQQPVLLTNESLLQPLQGTFY